MGVFPASLTSTRGRNMLAFRVSEGVPQVAVSGWCVEAKGPDLIPDMRLDSFSHSRMFTLCKDARGQSTDHFIFPFNLAGMNAFSLAFVPHVLKPTTLPSFFILLSPTPCAPPCVSLQNRSSNRFGSHTLFPRTGLISGSWRPEPPFVLVAE